MGSLTRYFLLLQENEIALLVLGSLLVNYRKKATIDGVVALAFTYGKAGVAAVYYYLDPIVFGWFLVYCTSASLYKPSNACAPPHDLSANGGAL